MGNISYPALHISKISVSIQNRNNAIVLSIDTHTNPSHPHNTMDPKKKSRKSPPKRLTARIVRGSSDEDTNPWENDVAAMLEEVKCERMEKEAEVFEEASDSAKRQYSNSPLNMLVWKFKVLEQLQHLKDEFERTGFKSIQLHPTSHTTQTSDTPKTMFSETKSM